MCEGSGNWPNMSAGGWAGRETAGPFTGVLSSGSVVIGTGGASVQEEVRHLHA